MLPPVKVSLSFRDGLKWPDVEDACISGTAMPLLMLKNGEADEKCGDALEGLYGIPGGPL